MEGAGAAFDFSVGPLIRGQLISRRDDEEHVLQLTLHHIVSDGWSMESASARELWTLYGAYRVGETDPVAATADPVRRLRTVATAVVEWGATAGARAVLAAAVGRGATAAEPAGDRARPSVQDYQGAAEWVELDRELTAGLKVLSQRCGTTLFMTVLASWAALLGRLSNQSEVVIGTPAANRTRTEVEGLIGFFVNTLALRVDLADTPNTRELLTRVKRVFLGAQAHGDIPFEQVVELVGLIAHSRRARFFRRCCHGRAPKMRRRETAARTRVCRLSRLGSRRRARSSICRCHCRKRVAGS